MHSTLNRTRWRKEEEDADLETDATRDSAGDVEPPLAEKTGGISWLELFLLYARHGGNEEETRMNARNQLRRPSQNEEAVSGVQADNEDGCQTCSM